MRNFVRERGRGWAVDRRIGKPELRRAGPQKFSSNNMFKRNNVVSWRDSDETISGLTSELP